MKKTLSVLCATLMLSAPLASFAQPGPPQGHDGGPSHQDQGRPHKGQQQGHPQPQGKPGNGHAQGYRNLTTARNRVCRYLTSNGSAAMLWTRTTVMTATG